MPSYTACNQAEATHLETNDTSPEYRGVTLAIVHKVTDGCLVVNPSYPNRHDFVRNRHARYYKVYVPPVVTFGGGRMDKVSTPFGDIPALAFGEDRLTDRTACEEFIRCNSIVTWTHVITYHDNKPVTIEELL